MRGQKTSWSFSWICGPLLLLTGGALALDAAPPENERPFDAGGGFSFPGSEKPKKLRRSVSGVACAVEIGDRRLCLVAFDEGDEARFVTLWKDGYAIDQDRVDLEPNTENEELDAEGAAADDRYYYVTGSHSHERENCGKKAETRRRVVRFEFDPSTGKARRTPTGALAGYAASKGLWPLLASLPEFRDHLSRKACEGEGSKSGEKNDVDIEGLAAAKGRLYFGFRSPAKDKSAYVLSVDAEGLFRDGELRPAVFEIEVGEGRGVRGLETVKDGFLVLAGPDDGRRNQDRSWIVALWDGPDVPQARLRKLARLDLDAVKLRGCDRKARRKNVKPEALAVLEDEKDHYLIAILSDGLCDGGPLTFRITR